MKTLKISEKCCTGGVGLYMTLIVAMLIKIYRQENHLGYKTTKRRMEIEHRELIIAIAIVQSGGDLKRLNLPAPEAFSGERPDFVPVFSSDHGCALPCANAKKLSALTRRL